LRKIPTCLPRKRTARREQSLAEQLLKVTGVAGRGLACLIADEVVRPAAALGVVGREPGGRVVFQEIDAGEMSPPPASTAGPKWAADRPFHRRIS